MRNRKPTYIFLGLFFLLGWPGIEYAIAQSTLANAPSTDVVAAKRTYLEFDFILNYASHQDGGFRSYVPRAVVGVGHNLEAGVNFAVTDALAPNQPIEVQPNFKWRFYGNENKGVAAAVGCILYAPITDRGGTDTFGLCYTVVSKKFNGTYGPRLTGGGYALVKRNPGNGARSGVIGGFEQPLHRRISFMTDWFSGRNRFGYVTPGFTFATTKSSTLYTGYSMGNSGRKNRAFFTFYGITFLAL